MVEVLIDNRWMDFVAILLHLFFNDIITIFPALHPQYKQDQEMFRQTAKLWSHVYAGAPVPSADYTRKIDKLCAMGFDKVRIKLYTVPQWSDLVINTIKCYRLSEKYEMKKKLS